MPDHDSKLGQHLALTVGAGLLATAAVLAVTRAAGPPVIVILVLVGASALAGWLKAGRR